ncbi:hypothetical protein BD626DRAFT_28799 [Schizophyllum amplum]|uniref:F-box domain-containing protein n=1 Tax=Schizophyllum amplum TaxID=97359 RepID=A0A550D067_9AGAR|nr:hypothetical protein BD626DRAFT_28799 [Auriculariopsis ampla]
MMCGEIDDLSVHPRDPRMDPVLLCLKPIQYCQTAIRIGYVCSRWLTVTRGCPQLWTMVDLPFPQRRDVTILELCLRYSAGLPMTLHLNDNKEYSLNRRNVDICQQFMRIVASAAHRWVGIHIYIRQTEPNVTSLLEPLYSLPTASFSALKHVTLRPTWQYLDDDGRQATLRLWDAFYASSALRTARWHNVAIDVHRHAPTLRQLTHVGVNAIRSDEVMELFRACPRLEVFQGIIVTPSGLFPGEADGYLLPALATPIVLPHLRILALRGMHDWSNLFDGLAVPLLNRLEINMTDVQAHAIERLLNRSGARLFMLAMRCVLPGNVEQIKALLRCPALQRLKIFVYQPRDGSYDEEQDYFDPRPFIPPNVVLCTTQYKHADDTYRLATIGM